MIIIIKDVHNTSDNYLVLLCLLKIRLQIVCDKTLYILDALFPP